MIYALFSPAYKLVAKTVSHDPAKAQQNAFDYLSRYAWAKPYWKRWDEFIVERKRRRWLVREVIVDIGEVVDK